MLPSTVALKSPTCIFVEMYNTLEPKKNHNGDSWRTELEEMPEFEGVSQLVEEVIIDRGVTIGCHYAYPYTR